MSAQTSDVVERAISHAQRLVANGYGWATARIALRRILADLETRTPNDPSLGRLRRFIAEGDLASTSKDRGSGSIS
jgi:hypothetical protein